MRVSCLCVTEDRPEFIPWLVWNFEKQTWPDKELVVIDSSQKSIQELLPSNTIYHQMEHRTYIPVKRNKALQMCTGDIVTWMDDDDWQHPRKCEILAEALLSNSKALAVGSRFKYFLDMHTFLTTSTERKLPIFGSLGIYREESRKYLFPNKIAKNSDSYWLSSMSRLFRENFVLIEKELLLIGLCHDTNISNTRSYKKCNKTFLWMRQQIHKKDWQASNNYLNQLRERLSIDGPTLEEVSIGIEEQEVMEPDFQETSQPVIGNQKIKAKAQHIGILATNKPQKGLFRDAESLLWVFEQSLFLPSGPKPKTVSVFPLERINFLEVNGLKTSSEYPCEGLQSCVEEGTLFEDWLRILDVVIVFETALPKTFQKLHEMGKRIIFIPNVDWAGNEIWASSILDAKCEVWAKTPQVAKALESVGLSPIIMSWSIPDPVVFSRKVPDFDELEQNGIRFFINGGMGGWKGRRAIDLAMQAFEKAYSVDQRIKLCIKVIKPLDEIVSDWREQFGHLPIEVIEGFESRAKIFDHYMSVDVFLYPTRWDGFGLSLWEALHAGLPCIATDGWPMNEVIVHEHNGLLVSAKQEGTIKLAPIWECDVDSLAKAMLRMLQEPDLLAKLTCSFPEILKLQQQLHIIHVQTQVLGNPSNSTIFAYDLFQKRDIVSERKSQSSISSKRQPKKSSTVVQSSQQEVTLKKIEDVDNLRKFWDIRSKKSGIYAVGHANWSPQQFNQQTEIWWKKFQVYLSNLDSLFIKKVLDFGCGTGRFSVRLRQMFDAVVGLDLSSEMIKKTKTNQGVDFIHIKDLNALTLKTNTFDLLFICTVLQHVPDKLIQSVQKELNRVLKPNSAIFLFENVHHSPQRTTPSGHVIFRKCQEYQDMFPGIQVVDFLTVEGQQHALLFRPYNFSFSDSSGRSTTHHRR